MDYEVSRIGEIIEGEEEDSKKIDLPPGFRFHPTEELITYYLRPKVLNTFFSALAICEVDLNKVEPWDLPWKAKIGEKEWYFFCVREREIFKEKYFGTIKYMKNLQNSSIDLSGLPGSVNLDGPFWYTLVFS